MMISSFREHFDNYLALITPAAADPTYSVLKAHLAFEEMLRHYLRKRLVNAKALSGARLTFAQNLAVARALTPDDRVEEWVWTAVGKLNKLRNNFAHGGSQHEIESAVNSYVDFVKSSAKAPLPPPSAVSGVAFQGEPAKRMYLAVDLVTAMLYYRFAGQLGFKVD